jgi:tetratricopeptide (TPR) repeat protein
LLQDAARKSGDAQIYKRATDLALSARAGENALQVARSWRQALPRSAEATRYVLQILLALNRLGEAQEPLKTLLELTPEPERGGLLGSLPSLFGRASDKKLAAQVMEQALVNALADAKTAASAWTSVAQMRAGASDFPAALDAIGRAQAVNAQHVPAALTAVDLMDKNRPQAEQRVKKYLDSTAAPAPQVRRPGRRLAAAGLFAAGHAWPGPGRGIAAALFGAQPAASGQPTGPGPGAPDAGAAG